MVPCLQALSTCTEAPFSTLFSREAKSPPEIVCGEFIAEELREVLKEDWCNSFLRVFFPSSLSHSTGDLEQIAVGHTPLVPLSGF